MTDRPILFSTDMVKAILDGRKTQTRRVVKTKAQSITARGQGLYQELWDCGHPSLGAPGKFLKCPYGEPGDLLWVRETWRYCANCGDVLYLATDGRGACWQCDDDPETKWKPSIHMLRDDSRITLRVTTVRVERVRDIRDSDAIAEGIICDGSKDMTGITTGEPVAKFADLWDSINAKRGYSWQSNPWVWVVEFERVTP